MTRIRVKVALDLHCNTFKIRFWTAYTQAYAAVHAGAIAHGTRSCQKRTPATFFFWSVKKGGSSAPSEPPWLRAWELVPARLGAVYQSSYILDVVGTFWIWRQQTCLDQLPRIDHCCRCWARHAPLTLFDCVTCAIFSRSLYATQPASGL